MKNWIRSLLPKTQGNRALESALESVPSASEAIHLEEVGLPNGKTTTLQWLKYKTSATVRIAERENRSQECDWETAERNLSDFANLMERIRELDSTKIENFTAPIRDGVVYFVAWGDRSNIRSVTLRNPESNSPQQGLVDLIKASVVIPQNKAAD